MKKKIFILFCLCMSMLLIYLIYLGQNRETKIEIYTIKEAKSYIYSQHEAMTIDLYSNKEELLLAYPNENTYSLRLDDDNIINLINVSVDKVKSNQYYIYTIYYYLPALDLNDTFIDVILEIKNIDYILNINVGKIKIINEEINLLPFNKLYPSYSYVNNSLFLTGINIELVNEFKKIESLSLVDEGYARFDLAINNLQENEINIKEIIPNYSLKRLINVSYKNENKTIFIPIAYKNGYFIRTASIEFVIDGIKYIIDSPTLITTKIELSDLSEEYIVKGELEYVKT